MESPINLITQLDYTGPRHNTIIYNEIKCERNKCPHIREVQQSAAASPAANDGVRILF